MDDQEYRNKVEDILTEAINNIGRGSHTEEEATKEALDLIVSLMVKKAFSDNITYEDGKITITLSSPFDKEGIKDE